MKNIFKAIDTLQKTVEVKPNDKVKEACKEALNYVSLQTGIELNDIKPKDFGNEFITFSFVLPFDYLLVVEFRSTMFTMIVRTDEHRENDIRFGSMSYNQRYRIVEQINALKKS